MCLNAKYKVWHVIIFKCTGLAGMHTLKGNIFNQNFNATQSTDVIT